MKKAFLTLTLIPILAACSGGAAGTPTPSATSPTSPPTPTRTTPPPKFTTAETALMDAAGWSATDSGAQDFIDSAHALCETAKSVTDADLFTAIRDETEAKRRTVGQILLLLCDDSTRYTPILIAVDIDGARADGTYYVGSGADEIAAGAYRTIGAAESCYWVRKNASGDIIDNDLVASAPGGVRMTVKASDHEVTMKRCGVWIPDEG